MLAQGEGRIVPRFPRWVLASQVAASSTVALSARPSSAIRASVTRLRQRGRTRAPGDQVSSRRARARVPGEACALPRGDPARRTGRPYLVEGVASPPQSGMVTHEQHQASQPRQRARGGVRGPEDQPMAQILPQCTEGVRRCPGYHAVRSPHWVRAGIATHARAGVRSLGSSTQSAIGPDPSVWQRRSCNRSAPTACLSVASRIKRSARRVHRGSCPRQPVRPGAWIRSSASAVKSDDMEVSQHPRHTRMLTLLLWVGVVLTRACVEHDWGVRRVVDGDTVVVEAPWLPAPLGDSLSVRIIGLDTPETRTARCDRERARGLAAKAFTQTMVTQHATDKARVQVCAWDKYGGRVLCTGQWSALCRVLGGRGMVHRGKQGHPVRFPP